MKNLALTLFVFSAFIFQGYSQAEIYNLESKNLHRKVRKTIEHYYKYDAESGGFVKTSVNIHRYNDDGNLAESYSLYNSKYSENRPIKKLFNYNADELLISTKDISDIKGKFSSENKYTYDRKGNLIKIETIYKDGSKFNVILINDKKGRVINKKEYSKKDVLTADVNYTYKGDVKTVDRTSFNSADGSIIGNYVTIFKDGVKTNYKSESKYGKSSSRYEYDKEDNLLTSYFSGKSNSKTTYDYVYDRKDNWIKKHYRSGKYQYFYFREIHFDNGNITGSTDFDKQFINSLGNFANVEVVPLKKKEKSKTITNTNNTNSSYIKNKLWHFDYIYASDKLKKLKGTFELKTLNDSNLKLNSDASFILKFTTNTFNFNMKVNSVKTLADKYEFKLSNDKDEAILLWIYKNTKPLKDEVTGDVFNVNGLFTLREKDGSSMSFYLK